jgi:hypothetical protein
MKCCHLVSAAGVLGRAGAVNLKLCGKRLIRSNENARRMKRCVLQAEDF